MADDHYLVTVHYTSHGHIKQKVLNTKAEYESQAGLVVADEINGILEEFQINIQVVAASNMHVALTNLKFLKRWSAPPIPQTWQHRRFTASVPSHCGVPNFELSGVAEEVHHGQNSPAGEAATSQ